MRRPPPAPDGICGRHRTLGAGLAPKRSSPSTTHGIWMLATWARRADRALSPRRWGITTLVSNRTLPAGFIDLLAAFLDGLFHRFGVFRREASGSLGENRLALFLADPLEPVHEIGGHFQSGRRKPLQVLDSAFARAHH